MNFNLHTCIRKPLQETEIYINYCAFQSKELTQETTALKEYDFETQIFKAATAVMQVTRKCLFPNHFPQKKKSIFVYIIDCTQSTINSFCPESCAFPNVTLVYEFK